MDSSVLFLSKEYREAKNEGAHDTLCWKVNNSVPLQVATNCKNIFSNAEKKKVNEEETK